MTLRSGREIGIPFFVQERLRGPDLENRLSSRALSEEEWLNLAFDLLSGVGHVHAAGVIHQDIKPSNVMVHHDRHMLVDFGLASYINREDPGDRSGFTLGYAAPEQLLSFVRGGPDASRFTGHVDIYALGCVLTAAATRHGPWAWYLAETRRQRDSQQQAFARVLEAMHSRPADVSPLSDVQRSIVEPMLAFDPTRRPSAESSLKLVRKRLGNASPRRRGQVGQRTERPAPLAKRQPSGDVPQVPAALPANQREEVRAHTTVPATKPRTDVIADLGRFLPQYWAPAPKKIPSLLLQVIWALVNIGLLSWLLVSSIFGLLVPLFAVLYIWFGRYFSVLDMSHRTKLLRVQLWSSLPWVNVVFGVIWVVRNSSTRSRVLAGAVAFAGVVTVIPTDVWGAAPIIGTMMATILGSLLAILMARDAVQTTSVSSTPVQVTVAPSDGRAFAEDESGAPLYSVSWRDIQADIYAILAQVGREQFVLEVAAESIAGIFMQGYFEDDGSATVECAADLSLRPKVTLGQMDALQRVGWEPPSRDIPNFIVFLSPADSTPDALADFFTRTLRDGYGLRVEEIRVD